MSRASPLAIRVTWTVLPALEHYRHQPRPLAAKLTLAKHDIHLLQNKNSLPNSAELHIRGDLIKHINKENYPTVDTKNRTSAYYGNTGTMGKNLGMSEIILHHFPSSPFGEKIRLVMGLKNLKWLSVDAELILPKPKLTALTGGYRKTPVMQIGAHIYCDSRLIAEELERRFPEKTLFPNSTYGTCHTLSSFADRDLLIVCSGIAIGVNKASFPAELMRDRKNLFGSFLNIDALDTEIPNLTSLLRSYLAVIENQLSDRRLFWAGDSPSLADLAIYAQIWTVRSFAPAASTMFSQFPFLQQWEIRVGQVGHGESSSITRDDAIHIARNSMPRCEKEIDPLDPLRLQEDDLVEVTPTDYGCIPVQGKLVTLTTREVAVEIENPEAGTVVVHFPRMGFKIVRLPATTLYQ